VPSSNLFHSSFHGVSSGVASSAGSLIAAQNRGTNAFVEEFCMNCREEIREYLLVERG
jgi:hypothetical protein